MPKIKRLSTRCLREALVVVLFVLLQACSDNPAQLPALSTDATILAFGDSITFGTGAAPEQSYPSVLSRLSGRRVVNAGVPGEVTAQGLKRLPQVIQEYQPALLILCHGGNDLLRKYDETGIRANLEGMIQTAQGQGIPVLLLGVPKPKLLFMEAAGFYKEIAATYKLLYLAKILPQIESDNALKADPIHPNASGYQRLAEALYSALQTSGAL